MLRAWAKSARKPVVLILAMLLARLACASILCLAPVMAIYRALSMVDSVVFLAFSQSTASVTESFANRVPEDIFLYFQWLDGNRGEEGRACDKRAANGFRRLPPGFTACC